MKLQINQRASDDLKTIFSYSLEKFGQQQAHQYLTQFQSHFSLLLANPLMGQDVSHIRAKTRRSVCHEHIIYYRATQNAVVVLRVIHGRQDPTRYL
jgi:toxin ParE1/3/4